MMPVVKMLKEYYDRKTIRLHMPGHKGKIDEEIFSKYSQYDVTELNDTDDLSMPNGAIKEAEKLYASLFGVKHAIFNVNGSSAGNIAFVLQGNNISIARNSHRSLFNALEITNRSAILINNGIYNGRYNLISIEQIEQLLLKYKEIDTIILTSPDYYGRHIDVKSIYNVINGRAKLYIDCAHGAHFGLSECLPHCVAEYSDACIVSVHKTLGGLNQTSVLLTNSDEEAILLRDKLRKVTTTSPSFGLIASIDYARQYAQCNRSKYKILYDKYQEFTQNVLKYGIITEKNEDFTRLVLDISNLGISGEEAYNFADKYGFVFEMADNKRLIAIITIFDEYDVYNKILEFCSVLYEYSLNRNTIVSYNGAESFEVLADNQFLIYHPDYQKNSFEECDIHASIGKILYDEIGLMPPCVPIFLKGEIITQKMIDDIDRINKSSKKYGIYNNKIRIYK